MARRKPTARDTSVLFNVVYEDGTLSSNRRIPGSALGGFEGDEDVARAIFEEQDRRISEQSGVRKAPIKSVTRA